MKFRSDLCFKDRTASCVRIVNGVEKYVTETTETIEDEELLKQDLEWNLQHPSLFFYTKESGWTSILEVKIVSATSYQMQWSDCHDMIKQFFGKPTEHWNVMILLKNSRRRKGSMVLCNGHLKIGYLFWPKEEDKRKSFSIVWILTLPDTCRISEQSKIILEVLLLILSCKTMYCCRKDLPSTSTTSEMWVKYIQ